MMKRFTLFALLLSVLFGSTTFAAEKFSTRTYPLSDFANLDVSSAVKVFYTQGDTFQVKLTGRTDWLDLMEVTADGGTLKLKAKNTKKFNNVKKKDQPDGAHNFILYLTAPNLKDIVLCGVSDFEGVRLTPENLSLRLEGVSKFKVDSIECHSLQLHLAGVSKVDAASLTCQELAADISGSCKVNLSQFTQGEQATFAVSGASRLTLSAEVAGKMQVSLTGASKGELTFKGGSLHTTCTGASKLIADVNCAAVSASCDGASKITFNGTADKVEIDHSGVSGNINTSRLNQF